MLIVWAVAATSFQIFFSFLFFFSAHRWTVLLNIQQQCVPAAHANAQKEQQASLLNFQRAFK